MRVFVAGMGKFCGHARHGEDQARTDPLMTARPDLLRRLRDETAVAHRRLEDELDLLSAGPGRFRAVLEGFHGFHRVWEPAMGTVIGERARLAVLERDLQGFGLTAAQIAALPRCHEASTLAQSPAGALGSFYVMEGSTLGGQVISRAPGAAGLGYFNPYGGETGAMWRRFRSWLEAQAAPLDQAEIVAGAVATFEVLRRWLAPRAAAAA